MFDVYGPQQPQNQPETSTANKIKYAIQKWAIETFHKSPQIPSYRILEDLDSAFLVTFWGVVVERPKVYVITYSLKMYYSGAEQLSLLLNNTGPLSFMDLNVWHYCSSNIELWFPFMHFSYHPHVSISKLKHLKVMVLALMTHFLFTFGRFRLHLPVVMSGFPHCV